MVRRHAVFEAMASTVKVLVAGDTEGNFVKLFNKVSKVNKAHGPFAGLFCVGNTLGSASSLAQLKEALGKYTDAIPLHTYFVASKDRGSALLAGLKDGGDLVPNLTYLGHAGVKDVAGLKVAYLSGSFDAAEYPSTAEAKDGSSHYVAAEVDRIVDVTKQSKFIGADVLLTSEWPSGYHVHLTAHSVPKSDNSALNVRELGTRAAAKLAQATTPRYHFCGSHNVFFTRLPYRNSSKPHVTRMLGLGKVKGPTKARFIYACNIEPLQSLSSGGTVPADATPCPYTQTPSITFGSSSSRKHALSLQPGDMTQTLGSTAKRVKPLSSEEKMRFGGFGDVEAELQKEMDEKMPYSRWNMKKRAPPKDYVCHRCRVPGHWIKDCPQPRGFRPGQAGDTAGGAGAGGTAPLLPNSAIAAGQGRRPPLRKDCWFCLGTPNAETHLVVSVADEAYIAMAKGGLNPLHSLILPVEHYASSLDASAASLKEIQQYKKGLREAFGKQGKSVVFYERFVPTNTQMHMHIQVVPVPKLLANDDAIVKAFLEKGEQQGFPFKELTENDDFKTMVQPRQPFIHVEFNSKRLLHVGSDARRRGYFTFARQVLADVYGQPDRGDWKKCRVSLEEETAATQQFKALFAPYDFAADDDDDDDDE